MAKPDISALSIDELNALMIEAKELAIKRRDEELKKLVDGLLEKSAAIDVTISELIAAIQKRETGSAVKKPKAVSGRKIAPGWENGVTYVNPAKSNEEWTGGNRGPRPSWLTEIIPKSLPHDDQVSKYLELVKPSLGN